MTASIPMRVESLRPMLGALAGRGGPGKGDGRRGTVLLTGNTPSLDRGGGRTNLGGGGLRRLRRERITRRDI